MWFAGQLWAKRIKFTIHDSRSDQGGQTVASCRVLSNSLPTVLCEFADAVSGMQHKTQTITFVSQECHALRKHGIPWTTVFTATLFNGISDMQRAKIEKH